METKQINWTARAIKDLRRVYGFYTDQIGEEKAFSKIENLLKKVDMLADERFVLMGAKDEYFAHLKREYRKLIEDKIKVTYRLSADKTTVYINRVFDVRQNPNKNK